MKLEKLIGIGARILFFVSAILLFIAVAERFTNLAGYTFLQQTPYSSARLLEFAAIFLLFVIAVLLRQIREELRESKTN